MNFREKKHIAICTLGRIIEFASECKGKTLYDKTADTAMVLKCIGFAFAGEALKYLLATKSMMLAHDSAYTILETIRKQLSEK